MPLTRRKLISPEMLAIRIRRYLETVRTGTNPRELFAASKNLLYLSQGYPEIVAQVLSGHLTEQDVDPVK